MHLTVIAKEPRPGMVKTRLVPPLTHTQAAEVARACLADTFEAVADVVSTFDDVRPVALIDGSAGPWIPELFEVVHQRGDCLGERLANGFADLGAGVVIGMDTPSARRWLSDALNIVARGHDAIGFTLDGGYWGIGLASSLPEAFDCVPMSTDVTGVRQLERLRSLGRHVEILPTVRDLDRFEDLAPLVSELPGSELARVAEKFG